ncbi:MAG: hypothetical protein H7Z72_21250 [Bacteroidetes bacterium]|nr:hypothetical protein [Fibrella sp.]
MDDQKNTLTMDDLRMKVSNYRTFATKELPIQDVFMSAVFHKDVIQQILDSTPDAHGVRIYMAKDTDTDASDDVSYLMVPVKAEDNGSFTDQIDDDNDIVKSGLLATTMCIGKFCNGSALHPPLM